MFIIVTNIIQNYVKPSIEIKKKREVSLEEKNGCVVALGVGLDLGW